MAKRQVVFIMTDTQRWDMLGCYRDTGLQTPNLDRLAEHGLRFERAYTCDPVCGPARAALFTGTYPHTNGSWANDLPVGLGIKTIGERLTDAGIHCAYVGKWHLDATDYFGSGLCPNGWDPEYWYDMRTYLEELTPRERLRSRKAETNRQPDLGEAFTYGHRCSDRAISFLERHSEEDFFLTVSYDEPHGPFLCPRPYSEMYTDFVFPDDPNKYDTLEDKPEHIRVWANRVGAGKPEPFEVRRPDYFGCNSFVDYEIGRVLDAVERLAPRTLVVYTSDHGDALGSHGIWNKGPTVYDEVTRVPLIVHWPGRVPDGAVCRHAATHIDLVPTVLDACGLEVPPFLEGYSMVPTLEDPSRQTREAVFFEFGRYEVDHDGFGSFQPMRCICDGRYKLGVHLLSTDELYDLQKDPSEMVNLIESSEHASIRDRLHDQLLEWMNRTRDPFRGYYWERRPWRADARAASWDYTGMTRQREADGYQPRMLDYNTGLEMKEAVRPK